LFGRHAGRYAFFAMATATGHQGNVGIDSADDRAHTFSWVGLLIGWYCAAAAMDMAAITRVLRKLSQEIVYALEHAMKTPIRLALSLVIATMPFSVDGAESDLANLETCAACHGANGISVAAGIPNLAGQKENYLSGQLSAFKEGTRENTLMNAIASQLDDDEIETLAAYFSSRQGASDGDAQSQVPAQVAMGNISFPDDYQSRLTVYRTVDYPAPRNEVRFNYANETALAAARADQPLPDGSFLLVANFSGVLGEDGNPITGPDGHFLPGDPVSFTAAAREPGWGDAIPALLRNENWHFNSFMADGTPNTGSQANCLACHVPRADTSYLFTHAELTETAKQEN